MAVTETRLSIRMSKEKIEQLKAYAESLDQSLSDWARDTLMKEAQIKDDKIAELERRIALLEANR